MNIEDTVAIVTGAASGLGRAAAEALVQRGARVVLLDLASSDGENVAQAIGATFAPTDVTSEDDVAAAVATARALGELRIAVNCAGIGPASRTVGRDGPHPLDLFQKVIEVNLIGTFNVLRLAAAAMPDTDAEERGVIVNTASIAAYEGQIGQVAYAASKGGVVGLTLPVARDLARSRIRCVTIAPGTLDTPMLGSVSAEFRQQLAAAIPHPARLGRPEEYAQLVCHIVENPLLNGEVIRLDGALRMGPR